MKISKILYFSPKYKYLELNWDEKDKLIEAFRDRVKGFYIQPAEQLNSDEKGFATGVLCITTLDFIAKFFYNNDANRMKKLLKNKIEEFSRVDPYFTNKTLADRFYEEFRNGLIHEGRIKNAGQFSYDFLEIVKVEEEVMIVNPGKLLCKINSIFDNYITQIKESDLLYLKFKESLRGDFKREIDYIKK